MVERKHRDGHAPRASFPNPQGLLLPGMFVQAVFTQAVDPNVFLVPQAAVQRDIGGDAYVFIVGAGQQGGAAQGRRRLARSAPTGW